MKNNKGFGGIALLLILAGALVVGGGAYYLKTKNNLPQENQNNNNAESGNIVTDLNDQNIKIYTSSKLGVTFKYASIDPMFNSNVKVTELNNKITANGGSLMVFEKNPKESLEVAVRRVILKGKTNFKNCSIKVGDVWNTNLDSTVNLVYGNGSFPGDENESDCGTSYFGQGNTFASSSKYPDRFVLIQTSTQSPDDILYKTGDKLIKWESTIELINKVASVNSISETTACLPTTAPYIKVLSPNGGEIYQAGQQITVTWSTCNPNSNQAYILVVLRSIPSDMGTKEIGWYPNTGTANITLPTTGGLNNLLTSGKYYKISLELGDGGMGRIVPTDDSDNLFTINNSYNGKKD